MTNDGRTMEERLRHAEINGDENLVELLRTLQDKEDEITELQHQVTGLEIELEEARSEADEVLARIARLWDSISDAVRASR